MIDRWSNCCITLPFEVKLKESYTLLPFCNTVAFINNNSFDFIFRSVSEKQSVLCEFSSASRLPNTKVDSHVMNVLYFGCTILGRSFPLLCLASSTMRLDPSSGILIKGDSTTRQKEDAVDCISAKSPPTQMALNKNGAISEHSDFPELAGERVEISLNNFFLAFS